MPKAYPTCSYFEKLYITIILRKRKKVKKKIYIYIYIYCKVTYSLTLVNASFIIELHPKSINYAMVTSHVYVTITGISKQRKKRMHWS